MIFWWISEKRNEADETVVKIWHLYAVEMCLRAKECTKFGGGAAEYNPGIRHFSGGNVDINYMKNSSNCLLYINIKDIFGQHAKKMPCNMAYYYLYFGVWRIKKLLMANFPLVQTVKSILSK